MQHSPPEYLPAAGGSGGSFVLLVVCFRPMLTLFMPVGSHLAETEAVSETKGDRPPV